MTATWQRLRARSGLTSLLAGLALAIIFCMQLACARNAPSRVDLTRLARADIVIQTQGAMPVPGIAGSPARRDIALPFSWDKMVGGLDGVAVLTFAFPRTVAASEPMAIATRIGNAFSVSLNGAEVSRMGVPGDRYHDTGKEYRLIVLPAPLLRDQNQLVITLYAQGGRNAGVTVVDIGSLAAARQAALSERRVRTYGALVVATISAMLGTLGLLIWMRQRETLYLTYAGGELLWSLQVSDTLLEVSPLPWPWWGAVVYAAYAIAPVLICKFLLMVLRRHHGWVRVALNGYLVLAVPVSLLVAIGRMPGLWPAWQTVLVLLALWVATLTVYHGVRSGKGEPRVLAVVVVLTAAAAIRDLVVIRLLPGGYGTSSWSRYAWILFGLTLGWIIAEQLRKASLAVARLNVTLSERLAAQEAMLQATFRERMGAERREAVGEERLRLTRDMHDGLGSQLAGALHLARNPNVPREVLADHLAQTLDQLKLTVDAMQDIEGDVASLLGALRYRISPRIEAAGLRLAWAVEALPPVPRWTAQQSRDLQLLLYEALSNVLQHAGATSVRLQARLSPGQAAIEIVLSDDGRGFDTSDADAPLPAIGEGPIGAAPHRGQGTANMRLRARRLGARLDVQSAPTGTRICLTLPLADAAARQPGPAGA